MAEGVDALGKVHVAHVRDRRWIRCSLLLLGSHTKRIFNERDF